MFTDNKVTEIYCLADDFCKSFDSLLERYSLSRVIPENKRRYYRAPKMSKAEAMLIYIMFHAYPSLLLRSSGKSIRLMCGLLIFKYLSSISDESVVEQWSENAYCNYTIKAIAESLGYKSHATFVKAFKSITGIMPSLFQKMAREERDISDSSI